MEKLVAIALGISAMSMFLSSAAIWPHSRGGLEHARNAFLWAMFAFIAVGGATVSFRKMKAFRARAPVATSEFASQRLRVEVPSIRPAVPRIRSAPPTRSIPSYDRLELRPRSGVATAPATHFENPRVYQANHYPE